MSLVKQKYELRPHITDSGEESATQRIVLYVKSFGSFSQFDAYFKSVFIHWHVFAAVFT
jgi:hypothetical protein